MPDRYRRDPYDDPAPRPADRSPPLPPWLVRKVLGTNEQIVWVRAPRWSPSLERYVTHPLTILGAAGVAALLVLGGCLLTPAWDGMPLAGLLAGGGVVVGALIVVGLANGYFTRLVVTNFRVVILQGYEVCRSWNVDQLPRSLVRYRREESGEESRAVDLDAMKTMFGGAASDGFMDPKTILAFGKELKRLKDREDGRP